MKSKKKQVKREALSVLETLSDAQKTTVVVTGAYMKIVSEMYDSVIDQCGVSVDEKMYYKEMLIRHSENALVASMIKNMDEKFLSHFRDFVDRERVINPGKDFVACLIDFTVIYPELREKAYKALDNFFEEFIADVKRIRGI